MVRSSDVYSPACVFSSKGPWPHTTSTLTPSHQLQLSVINLQRCVQGVMLILWRCRPAISLLARNLITTCMSPESGRSKSQTKLVTIPKFIFTKNIWILKQHLPMTSAKPLFPLFWLNVWCLCFSPAFQTQVWLFLPILVLVGWISELVHFSVFFPLQVVLHSPHSPLQ